MYCTFYFLIFLISSSQESLALQAHLFKGKELNNSFNITKPTLGKAFGCGSKEMHSLVLWELHELSGTSCPAYGKEMTSVCHSCEQTEVVRAEFLAREKFISGH